MAPHSHSLRIVQDSAFRMTDFHRFDSFVTIQHSPCNKPILWLCPVAGTHAVLDV